MVGLRRNMPNLSRENVESSLANNKEKEKRDKLFVNSFLYLNVKNPIIFLDDFFLS